MFKKMPIPEDGPRPAALAIDEQPPYAVLVVSPDVYDAIEAAVQIAYEDMASVPIEYREAATELWAGFHDGDRAGS